MISAMTAERSNDPRTSELVRPVSLSIELSRAGGNARRFDLRVFFPRAEAASTGLANFLNDVKAEDEGEAAWVVAMLDLYVHHGQIDPHRTRRFSMETFQRCKVLRKHAKMVGAGERVEAGDLIKLSGAEKVAPPDLLHRAIYRRPDIRIDLSREDYTEFRDMLLGELLTLRADLEDLKEQAVQKARSSILADGSLSEADRAVALSKLEEVAAKVGEDEIPKLYGEFMRRVSKDAMKAEQANSAKFTDVVEESRRLLVDVRRRASTRSLDEDLGGEGEAGKAYADVIRENLDADEAKAVLWKTIVRYEEVYGIKPIRNAELIEIPEDEEGDDQASIEEGEVPGNDGAVAPERMDQYIGFWMAYASHDAIDKWNSLVWISTQLVNRNECVRLAVREAEDVYHGVQEKVFLRIYRGIRGRLTREERRAFLLLHTRLPALGGRIASLDTVVTSFFTGMDHVTQALAVLVLVFRVREWEGERLDEELERRWRAYLRLYPIWFELVRWDDRERWQQREHREVLFSDPDALDKRHEEDPVLKALMEEGEDVASWAAKYCDPEETRCVVRHFVDGWSQERIAREEKITQQAVSKRLQKALDKIRRGLVR